MNISVIDPISPAIERTKLILFQPFDLGKWLKLGFCAFLASLGTGGGGGGSGGGGGGGGNGEGPQFDPVWQWIQENLTLILSITAALFVVGCFFGLLIIWLSSRGKFMFIDGIVHNRGAVAAPWREYRPDGNSLFLFRVMFGLCCFLVFLLLVGVCALIALPSIQAQEFGGSAVLALVIGISLMILFSIIVGLVNLCLTQFVVPIMYLRRVPVMAAWGEFRHQILAGRIGTFILYVLFQIVIGFSIGVIALFATCLTCCLAAIPYLGTVLLLPLAVFVRSYSLYFLEQFGPEWTFFGDNMESKESPFVVGPENPRLDELT